MRVSFFCLLCMRKNRNNQIYLVMKEFVKYLGVVLALIGVVIFIAYSQMIGGSNSYLVAGMACVTLGVVAHILINKFVI